MKSMTGFGKVDYQDDKIQISAELRSVNNRNLDMVFNISNELKQIESKLRSIISSEINRGRVELYMRLKRFDNGSKKLSLNRGLIEQLLREVEDIKEIYDINLDVKLEHVLRIPEIIELDTSAEEMPEWVINKISDIIKEGIKKLVSMRTVEGTELQKNMEIHITQIEKHLKKIVKEQKKVEKELLTKVKTKVEILLDTRELDEHRLLQEVAYMSEKAGVNEELERLDLHAASFRETIKQDGPIGKKLDFILQEMNREINTLNAKTLGLEVNKTGLEVKLLIEKLREQVQNVE